MSAIVGSGYKASQIGPIPTDWTVASFGSLLSESPQYGANATAESAAGADRVRYIRITDIHENGSLIDSGKKYLNKDAADGYLLADQDIVIARTGNTVGKSLLYRASMGEAAFAGYLIRFRTGDALDCRYASQFLRSDAYWAWVRSSVKVGAQPNINSQQYQSLLLPLPSVAEQQKIASILEVVDEKLDVIARQIEATHTLKQGLMQTLFSRGTSSQAAVDWPTVELHEVAQVRTGVAKGKKGLKEPVELPYLRVANVQAGHIDLSEVKTIEVEASYVERYALQAGDVLMTEGGDFDKLGRGDVWLGQIEPCLHQNHVFAVRPDLAQLNPHYLAEYASSEQGRKYFLACAKRTTNLASINSSQLKAFPIPLPPLETQAEIAAIAASVNAKIKLLEAKRREQEKLKRGLMQKLLTGEWRVKVDAEMAA